LTETLSNYLRLKQLLLLLDNCEHLRTAIALALSHLPRVEDRSATQSAVDRAGAAEVIDRLAYGLETQLGPSWDEGAEVSFGQWQKLALARGFMRDAPLLLILDEPTAALDVSVQAVVLNLLQDLKASMGMSYLFVSHDLNVVRLLCDRVIVMRAGRIVEQGQSEKVLGDPQDAYTKELLTAIPHPPLPVH